MDDLWFEEELEPQVNTVEAQVKASREEGLTVQKLQQAGRGVVRADTPIWGLLGDAPLTSGRSAVLWKVRLRFQFETRSESAYFASARCEAYLESVLINEPMPTVYDLYPQELNEGEPRVVSLKFSPSLKVAGVEATVGGINTDVDIGKIEPVVIGYPGEQERAPFWEVWPKNRPLKGTRTFWLVVAQPQGCTGICLRARVEGIIQTKWGPIAVYPKERVWDSRPRVIIQ